MKILLQTIVSLTTALMFIFSINLTTIHAQSGEGIDGCTYYWNYGFKDATSCRRWLDYKENSARPEWTRKLNGCMVYASAFTAAQAKTLLVTNIIQAFVSLGGTFIGCMFY